MNNLADIILDVAQSKQARTMVIAKIMTPPPNLHLKFSEQVIYPKQIYCSNYLLPHYHRDYKIDGVIDEIKINVEKYDFSNTTATEPKPTPHTHDIESLSGKGAFEGVGTYKSHKDIWFEDTLKEGDEVLVAIIGQFYVVISKITKMPNSAIEGV